MLCVIKQANFEEEQHQHQHHLHNDHISYISVRFCPTQVLLRRKVLEYDMGKYVCCQVQNLKIALCLPSAASAPASRVIENTYSLLHLHTPVTFLMVCSLVLFRSLH